VAGRTGGWRRMTGMTSDTDPNERSRLWRAPDELEVPPAGDVVIREPREGWSRAASQAALQRSFGVRGVYPRTARMHPSTAIAVAPAEGVAPRWWPVYEVRRHSAPTRILLSDDAPQLPE
jgi:hypothetical protein